MKSISDLGVKSQLLFVSRMRKFVSEHLTSEQLAGGLDTRIENMTDTLNTIGLKYDKNGDKLYSHFELINDLSIVLELTHKDSSGVLGTYKLVPTEFDLQYADERENLYEYLEQVENYRIIGFDSNVFHYDENTNLYDVLDVLNLLSQLNQDYQKMFVEIYQNNYTESPIDLANTLITHLKDW